MKPISLREIHQIVGKIDQIYKHKDSDKSIPNKHKVRLLLQDFIKRKKNE